MITSWEKKLQTLEKKPVVKAKVLAASCAAMRVLNKMKNNCQDLSQLKRIHRLENILYILYKLTTNK